MITDLVTSACEQTGIMVRILPGGFLEPSNGEMASIFFGSDLRYHIDKPRPAMKSIVDDDCRQTLKSNNRSLNFVPGRDEAFVLKEVCNGGPVEDLADIVHEDFRRTAIGAAEVLTVEPCTVDMIRESISEPRGESMTVINKGEDLAGPGHHRRAHGRLEAKRVRDRGRGK